MLLKDAGTMMELCVRVSGGWAALVSGAGAGLPGVVRPDSKGTAMHGDEDAFAP